MSGAWPGTQRQKSALVLESSPSALVTLHFLRSALRRRWFLCLVAWELGFLLAIGWTWYGQTSSTASVTVLLAHDTSAEPATAMATDVSLLDTRAVATAVIEELGLDMKPEDFQASVTALPLTSQLLELQVTAPDHPAAVSRATVLADTYLEFRETQLLKQATAVIEGYRERLDSMEQQMEVLTSQYGVLSTGGTEQQGAAADVLAERSRVAEQASLLQQRIEDTSLEAGAIVAASNVLDPAHVESRSVIQVWGLPLVTGGIGGLGVGVMWVLTSALTSDRLRRRDEIALAIDAPVLLSVGRIHGRWWWPAGRRAQRRDLDLVVEQVSPLIDQGDRPSRLAFVALDEVPDVAISVWQTARRCADRGSVVRAVDLSWDGALKRFASSRSVRSQEKQGGSVELLRPNEDSLPATGRSASGTPAGQPATMRLPRARTTNEGVTLALAEVNPGLGVDSLVPWARDAVLFVSAGGSSAEELRTVSDLLRAAGVRLHGAVLTRADALDTSSGRLAGDTSGVGTPRKEAR